ncbi:efflux RND transporter periplasmic adaptor subunit [Desulforamulus aeronauticus]|uniref:HlyD family secretion protein n=1 Tax=Desulforamulus aeronauticus DSM 10349 TaxID=1121421 RepID=A0A1M6SS66_9FIRM|nr:efflux RND transporter periplasmic adaptor subunit [Desulforamulus aeronauticus]SHK47529.1 HlyD family secretion protein [Desulforamulus aeronauticus DSM 10349]
MEAVNSGELSRLQKMKLRIKGCPRWLKWLLGIILLSGILMLALNGRSNNGLLVQTAKLEMKSIEQSVVAAGKLESADKQEFFTPVDSTLMELSVKVGDKVKKGDVLGRLDTQELGRLYQQSLAKLAGLEAQLAKATASSDQLNLAYYKVAYDKAKNDLDRITHLHNEGAVAITELEQVKVAFAKAETDYQETSMRVQQGATAKEISSLQAQVSLGQQEVAQAKERLDLANFIAQEDGVVLFVGKEKGNRVLEGTRLLEIGSDSNLEVTANVNEIDAGTLKVGQPATITCNSLPEKEFTGEVTRVASVAIQESNANGSGNTTVPVTVQLKGDAAGLKPGYTVDVSIVTMEAKKLLALPFEALISQNGEKYVFVVKNGIVKKQRVKTEKGNELFDVVISGLKEGEEIILSPAPSLKDGQRVTTGVKNDKGK